ncbi:MAG: DOMON-like domain-containing protein [Steroidobacteraceae bacterium]|nr:DOMON-like domain-containing protein [Steroidobacteraceae bacterium]
MADAAAHLVRHPASHDEGARAIRAALDYDARGGLALHYRVDGTMAGLRWAVDREPGRADGLWQHGCFEVFLQGDGHAGYLEFNFAPCGSWAAYRFEGRRSGRESPAMPVPRIEFGSGPEHAELNVAIAPDALAEFAGSTTIRAGLAAVLEDGRGRLSYWALAHAAEAPDFHDPATFTIALPAR